MTNPFRQKRETLSEFNARRAKERKPIARMSQVGATPAGKPNLEKLRQNATEYTYTCPDCRDIGWLIRESRKGAYSQRCTCGYWITKKIKKLQTTDDIPI